MGRPYAPQHARHGYPSQTHRGRHSRPDSDSAGSPLPWLVGIGTLLLIVVMVAVAVPGSLLSTEFDEWAVARGVAQVLTASGYSVGQVSCPAGQPVEVGQRFSCGASVDGQLRDVTITVRTSGGEYEVGAPR